MILGLGHSQYFIHDIYIISRVYTVQRHQQSFELTNQLLLKYGSIAKKNYYALRLHKID